MKLHVVERMILMTIKDPEKKKVKLEEVVGRVLTNGSDNGTYSSSMS